MSESEEAADTADLAAGGDDLSVAPVPDLDRISRCTCSLRASGTQVELWGPPAGILSIARWLRSPSEEVATLAGEPRSDWEPGPAELAIAALDDGADGDGLVGLSVTDRRCTLTGSRSALEELAGVFESIGVYALDVRWSPVERRQLVAAEDASGPVLLRRGSPSLLVASAYPRDP